MFPFFSFSVFDCLFSHGVLFVSQRRAKRCSFFVGIAIFILGLLKGRLARYSSVSILNSGLMMTFNGALAGATAYLLGWGMASIVTAEHSCH